MCNVFYRDYYGNEQLVASFRFFCEAEKYINILHKMSADRYTIRKEEELDN